MTNKKLRYWFRRYNKKYFSNRLPEISVKFKDITRAKCIGQTHYECYKPVYVAIDNELKTWSDMAKMTLLHEMCHVALPLRVNHGPRFQDEMLRLARAGAFNGLW